MQRMTGIMWPATGGRDPVNRCSVQRRSVVDDASTTSTSTSTSSSPAVTRRIVRDGQRPRAAHLTRRLAIDVGKALSESGTAMWQKPDPAGPRARCPKF